jgi:hypothetical protein
MDQREGGGMKNHQPSDLPAYITNALNDRRGERIHRAADALAAVITELHGVPCHIRIGSDCAFVMVIKDLSDEAGAEQ